MARPLAFNPEEKLQQAMKLFWQKGYANTSITDITDTLGINRFSLYNTFGDKDALYSAALEHYFQKVFLPLLAPLEGELSGLAAIDAYLENFAVRLQTPFAAHGCLMQESAIATNGLDEKIRRQALQNFMKLRDKLRQQFMLAKKKAEINADVDDCLNFTLMNIQALIITRKIAGNKLMLQNTAFLREQIQNW